MKRQQPFMKTISFSLVLLLSLLAFGCGASAKDTVSENTSTSTAEETVPAKDQVSSTTILVQIAGKELQGTLEDTPLAKEIATQFPISVETVSYGGREYYGSLSFTPTNDGVRMRNFADGDITYCPQNNTIAIFYAQTDRPNLTMDVIRIGHLDAESNALMSTFGDREVITFVIGK